MIETELKTSISFGSVIVTYFQGHPYNYTQISYSELFAVGVKVNADSINDLKNTVFDASSAIY